jgi:hypothetical protein
LKLQKVNFRGKPAKETKAWELDIDPALSYVYDKGLRFGVLHRFNGNSWVPDAPLSQVAPDIFLVQSGSIRYTVD